MTAQSFAAKFAVPIVLLMAVLTGCQGVYVAGDVGPHATHAKTDFRATPASR